MDAMQREFAHEVIEGREWTVFATLRRLTGEPEDKFKEGDRVIAGAAHATVTKRRANGT